MQGYDSSGLLVRVDKFANRNMVVPDQDYEGIVSRSRVHVFGGLNNDISGEINGATVAVRVDDKEVFRSVFRNKEVEVGYLLAKFIAEDISKNGLNSTFLKKKKYSWNR